MRSSRARGVVAAVLAVVALAGCRASGQPSSAVVLTAPSKPLLHLPHHAAPITHRFPGWADGAVPPGTTVFDRSVPAVTKLHAALRRALRRAASDASRRGIVFYVESGWRSRAYQQQLFDEAVAKYGSTERAAHWVATPGTSAHERGDAVDIGHSDATAWLSRHGAAYGLCQIYRNERWHFELRPAAVEEGCPRMYADPTQDPRLQPR